MVDSGKFLCVLSYLGHDLSRLVKLLGWEKLSLRLEGNDGCLLRLGGGAKQFWIRANGSKLDYHWEEPFQIIANLDKSLS